jgi:phosphoribosyl 1,2-cyclic phosphodiesterase
VITHEHLDHAKGALKARDKWRWTLISTAATLEAIGIGKATARLAPLDYGAKAAVGDLTVTLIRVTHDAVAPAAVLIEDGGTGMRAGVAQDLGEIPAGLERTFADLDMLVLESNHCSHMLRSGPYPPSLQARIAGINGHLSNEQSARFAERVAHRGLKAIVMAHLSEQNNTPQAAKSAMKARLRHTKFRGMLGAARQDRPSVVGTVATQLNLF